MTEQTKIHSLSDEEVRRRLCLNNPALISQILSHALKYFDASVSGRKAIDEKANWFLAMDTACLALFFTGISTVLPQLNRPTFLPQVFLFASVLCIALFYISVFLLFLAIRARSDFRTINEADLLDKEILDQCDENKDSEDWSSTIYDRFIVSNLLKIASVNFKINESKGRFLKSAQWLFFAGLSFLAFVSILISYTLIEP